MHHGTTVSPLVSAIVPSKNRPERVVELIRSLRSQNYPAIETIVIDDGSDPPLLPLHVDLQIRNETSLGACVARNLGIEHASGEFLLLVDDDSSLPDPDTISRAVDLARRNPRVGALAFHILDANEESHSWQVATGGRTRFASKFSGCGALLRRETVAKIGGFNPLFGYYYEEMEMSLRMLDAGYFLLYEPSLRVIHAEDPRGRDWERIGRLDLRNTLYSVLLRYPSWLVLPALPVHLIRHWRRARLCHGSSSAARGLLWSLMQLVRTAPRLLRDRRPVRLSTLQEVRRLNRLTFLAPDEPMTRDPLLSLHSPQIDAPAPFRPEAPPPERSES